MHFDQEDFESVIMGFFGKGENKEDLSG